MYIFKKKFFLILIFLILIDVNIINAESPLSKELINVLVSVRYDDETYKKQLEIFSKYTDKTIEIYEKYKTKKYSECKKDLNRDLDEVANSTGMIALTGGGKFESGPIVTKDESGNYKYEWGIYATGEFVNGGIDGRLFADCIDHEVNGHRRQFEEEGLQDLYIERQKAMDNNEWRKAGIEIQSKIDDKYDIYLITDEIGNHTKSKEYIDNEKTKYENDSDGNGFGDSPDDNFAVNDSFFPDVFYYRQAPDVSILMTGFNSSFSRLSGGIKKSYIYTDLDTNPQALLSYVPVLLIPSGGLQGLDNSQMFKDMLSEYVSSGGTLVCLSQQHGYEYSALPAGEKISAYGWLEDQGCFSNAIYIDQWHQVLSGQSSATISASVDGYFTSYPDSTTVLLRRTKNNEPAMIMYPYGQGMVIATTMYEDWAY
ncbi:MAG: hypothetical protein AB1414_16195, partial [bacterium]